LAQRLTQKSDLEGGRWDAKNGRTEDQIKGFLREASSGLHVAKLCRRHGLAETGHLKNTGESKATNPTPGVMMTVFAT
jgi:putative transposase